MDTPPLDVRSVTAKGYLKVRNYWRCDISNSTDYGLVSYGFGREGVPAKMNWKAFDAIRRQSSPLQVDLMEAYAANKISRRDFVRRGTILGVGAPVMGAVLAACGSAVSDTATGSDGGGGAADVETVEGGEVTVGIQFGDANSGLDPLNMLDLGTYSVLASSFEYLVGSTRMARATLVTVVSPSRGSQTTTAPPGPSTSGKALPGRTDRRSPQLLLLPRSTAWSLQAPALLALSARVL